MLGTKPWGNERTGALNGKIGLYPKNAKTITNQEYDN